MSPSRINSYLFPNEGAGNKLLRITYIDLYYLNGSVRGKAIEPGERRKLGRGVFAKLLPVEIERPYFLLRTFRNGQLPKIDILAIQYL